MQFDPERGLNRTPTATLHFQGITVNVYENDDGYHYFCCETCGACGTMWLGRDYALVQALMHMHFFDHQHYLEDHHGSDNA